MIIKLLKMCNTIFLHYNNRTDIDQYQCIINIIYKIYIFFNSKLFKLELHETHV